MWKYYPIFMLRMVVSVDRGRLFKIHLAHRKWQSNTDASLKPVLLLPSSNTAFYLKSVDFDPELSFAEGLFCTFERMFRLLHGGTGCRSPPFRSGLFKNQNGRE